MGIGARVRPEHLWRSVLGLVLGGMLLLLTVRGIRLPRVWAAMGQAELHWIALALGSVLLSTAAKAGRWQGLFPRSQRRLPYVSLARALLVGQLVNALLPARLGEVARSYVLGRDEGASKATGLGTIASEKVFDVLLLLVTAGLAAALTSLPAWLNRSLAAIAVFGGVLFVAAVALPERWIADAGGRVAGWLPRGLGERVADWLEHGLAGLESLRRPESALVAIAWSVLIWALAASTNGLLFLAFHLRLSVGAALLLLCLLHVGTAPPSSPVRLGVFHAITVAGLASLGIDRSDGLAYATVLHAVVYAPQIVLGALALTVRPSGKGPRP